MGKLHRDQMAELLRDLTAKTNEDGTKSVRSICVKDGNNNLHVLDLKMVPPTRELAMMIEEIREGGWDDIFELTKKGEDHLTMRDEYRIYLGLTQEGQMYRNEPTKEVTSSETKIVGGRAKHSEAVYSYRERR